MGAIEIGINTGHSLIKWYELENYKNVARLWMVYYPLGGDSNSFFLL